MGCGGARTAPGEVQETTTPHKESKPSILPAFNEGDDILEVALSISAPFSDASISVDAHGYLSYYIDIYPPVDSGQKHEQNTVTLSGEQFEDLRSLIVETKIFSIDKAAWQIEGEDCSSYYLFVKTPEGDKTFSCVCKCPEEFMRIHARLQDLLGEDIVEYGF
jgi:hypothetical protein